MLLSGCLGALQHTENNEFAYPFRGIPSIPYFSGSVGGCYVVRDRLRKVEAMLKCGVSRYSSSADDDRKIGLLELSMISGAV